MDFFSKMSRLVQVKIVVKLLCTLIQVDIIYREISNFNNEKQEVYPNLYQVYIYFFCNICSSFLVQMDTRYVYIFCNILSNFLCFIPNVNQRTSKIIFEINFVLFSIFQLFKNILYFLNYFYS